MAREWNISILFVIVCCIRANGGVNNTKVDYAAELKATNFDHMLRDTPASYAIIEFYAQWCPACRNYKPHYEKVARLFSGSDAPHPGIIFMGSVDCASKLNNKVCDRFSLIRYPTLLWGTPSEFISHRLEPTAERAGVRAIESYQTAENLLQWINQQLGSTYQLDDKKFENEHLSLNISKTEQIARAVYDVEEATALMLDIIIHHKMIDSKNRASLIKFLQLLVAHHPSERCRRGSAEILVNFNGFFPKALSSSSNRSLKTQRLGSLHICGRDVPRGYWLFCRGSRNDTRGFSCGLWILLHSLSVGIDDGESQFAFTVMCDFVYNFFRCEECRQHFHQMCSSVHRPFNTSKELALWLWSTHNKVNKRLMKEEASLGTGDPMYPKSIWPPKKLCSHCHLSDQVWDMHETHKFLTNYYGVMLVSRSDRARNLTKHVPEETAEDYVGPANDIAVPIGAALAIAVASCCFGALAYYWRYWQKSLKCSRFIR